MTSAEFPEAADSASSSGGAGSIETAQAPGSVTRNSLPRLRPGLVATTVPPCISTICRTSAARAPAHHARPLDSWSPGRTCQRFFEVLRFDPITVSRTRSATWPSSCAAREHDPPPGGVNLTALLKRLSHHLREPGGVGVDVQALDADVHVERLALSLRNPPDRIHSRVHDPPQIDTTSHEPQLPARDRLASIRSSIRRTRCLTWRSMTSRALAARAPCGWRSISTAVRIGGSGLRSSCASSARNSSLRRSASGSASSCRRSRSRCSRSWPIVASSSRGALGDAPLELAVEPLELRRLAIQLDEDADLGAQDLGHDRHRDVVDRARLRSPCRRSMSVRCTAETKMIAVFWNRGCWRIIAASSKPSSSGMLTSISTTATSS